MDKKSPDDSLKNFYDEIPALGLLGTPHLVHPTAPYVVDEEVQLVCKYLRAYKSNKINRLYKESESFLITFVCGYICNCVLILKTVTSCLE